MHRFYVEDKNIANDSIIIDSDDVNHISKVLRLRVDDEIIVCDGKCNEYMCSIESIEKKQVLCKILSQYSNKVESPVEITLFQGLPKAQKMDLIIQKSVEIGVACIQPVITKRVVVKVEYRDITNKLDRWRRISMEAAKQSGRGIIPKILEPIDFDEAVKRLKAMDIAVMPYEKEEARGLKEVLATTEGVTSAGIFIGPEGGFEDSEVKACREDSIIPVSLGPRILRTETAGFVTAAMIQYEIGDMGGNIVR